MPSPTTRSTQTRVAAWVTAHQRAVAMSVLAIAALLVVIASALTLALLQDAPTTAAAPTASASPMPTSEPTIPAASDTPIATAAPTPDPTLAPEHRLAEGWTEVGSFGADGSIEAVYDVIEAPFGLLAAGVHLDTRALPVLGPLPQQGRVWLSSDGGSWEDVTPGDGTFAASSVYDLLSLRDGTVVAFARSNGFVDGNPAETYAAWETKDGRSWTNAQITAGGSGVREVVDGGAGYLAIRNLEDGSAELWHSADGRAFESVLAFPNGRVVASMAGGPEGFVVISRSVEGTAASMVHASGNGTDWYEATPPVEDAVGVAPLGADWLGVGWGQFAEDLMTVSETSSWFSGNGLDWAESGAIPLRAVELAEDMTCREFVADQVSVGSLVVASSLLSYPCGEGNVQNFGASHITADGTTWVMLPFTGTGRPGETRGTTVSAGLDLENGTLLAGESDYRATFWFRPDD